jgi:polyisoprenoid-binding protein YceI
MKHFNLFIASFLIYFASFAQETWTVDNPHSNVRFEVGWEDFSMRTGEFKIFDGSIVTDSREDLSNAVFEFNVDVTSVDVIADRLANHIKSDKFLDVEKFPEITYHSNQATKTSDTTYLSKGKLTIHGVEKEQDVSIRVKGYKETKRGYIYGLEVSLVVNKNDFGLDWGSPRLADKISIVGHLLYKMKAKEEE